jgi:hypothetical protein
VREQAVRVRAVHERTYGTPNVHNNASYIVLLYVSLFCQLSFKASKTITMDEPEALNTSSKTNVVS